MASIISDDLVKDFMVENMTVEDTLTAETLVITDLQVANNLQTITITDLTADKLEVTGATSLQSTNAADLTVSGNTSLQSTSAADFTVTGNTSLQSTVASELTVSGIMLIPTGDAPGSLRAVDPFPVLPKNGPKPWKLPPTSLVRWVVRAPSLAYERRESEWKFEK
jgi:hypothetical protein